MDHSSSVFLRWGVVFAALGMALSVWTLVDRAEVRVVRFATFNVSLYRSAAGELIEDLAGDDSQARAVAEVIQRVAPDVLLLNEFDYDPEGEALDLFLDRYLGVGQNGAPPIRYAFRFLRPVNTGVPTGMDLDRDGETGGPGDAFGYGRFPGQYGMVLLSRYPILEDRARTFQNFLWRSMPSGLLADDPATPDPDDGLSPEMREVFRLSSKSHWDVPLQLSDSLRVHVLASHPTPPLGSGNSRRNHDEIRFWADYVVSERSRYVRDDQGKGGGLISGVPFVIMGDLNADPTDGDSHPGAIASLLEHPRVQGDVAPGSPAISRRSSTRQWC